MARNRNAQLATHTITRLQDKCMSLEIEISNLRNEVQVLRNGAMALLTENAELRCDVQRLRAELPTPQMVQEANNLIQGLLCMYDQLEAEKRNRDLSLGTGSASSASSSAIDLEQSLACVAYLEDEPELCKSE
ncbi:uncharacterized protein ARMOST_15008 [Armillaria ostoyae]|uniref:Uncharacterized protein n=1 Tax=Armillaria ostoyae TaxID=47428 RepID=A0A284RS60_ARMOS|nr:uncharacterized protein ARMOST_15008 [Armillaria ostoyae]